MNNRLASTEASPENGNKRTRFTTDAAPARAPTSLLKAGGKSPMAAAKECSDNFIATLHPELKRHFLELTNKFLLAYSSWYYKDEKLQKMKDDVDFISSSAKIGLTLNAVDAVRESEEFRALEVETSDIVATCQRQLQEQIIKERWWPTNHLHQSLRHRPPSNG